MISCNGVPQAPIRYSCRGQADQTFSSSLRQLELPRFTHSMSLRGDGRIDSRKMTVAHSGIALLGGVSICMEICCAQKVMGYFLATVMCSDDCSGGTKLCTWTDIQVFNRSMVACSSDRKWSREMACGVSASTRQCGRLGSLSSDKLFAKPSLQAIKRIRCSRCSWFDWFHVLRIGWMNG